MITYGDYRNTYRQHPETKSADPGNGDPCRPWSRGVLEPLRVAVTSVNRTGKESNQLSDDAAQANRCGWRVIAYFKPERRDRGMYRPCNQAPAVVL